MGGFANADKEALADVDEEAALLLVDGRRKLDEKALRLDGWVLGEDGVRVDIVDLGIGRNCVDITMPFSPGSTGLL